MTQGNPMPPASNCDITYSVSLDFWTDPGTERTALARHTGIPADEFYRADRQPDRGHREKWYITSEMDADAPLDEHIASLLEAFSQPDDDRPFPAIQEVVLNIRHFPGNGSTPPTIDMPATLICRLHHYCPGLRISISGTPGAGDEARA